MYIPKQFEIKDEEVIYEIVEENSFATLFSQHQGHPYAAHLPLILNKKEDIYTAILQNRISSGKI